MREVQSPIEAREESKWRDQAHAYAREKTGSEPENPEAGEGGYWDKYYTAFYEYLLANLPDEEELSNEQFLYDILTIIEQVRGQLERGNPSAYKFFDTEKARQELFEFSQKVAEYLHEHRVKNFILMDQGARPLYVGMREYWKNKFPSDKMPSIYFLNPMGFKTRENTGTAPKDNDIVKLNDKDVEEEFQKSYSELMKDREEPTVVFDTYLHNGKTLEPVVGLLRRMGFNDVKIGAVNPANKGSVVKEDFHLSDELPEKGFYPFDRDRLIEKTFEHVNSIPTADGHKEALGTALRIEIKRIMEEKLK